MRTAPLPQAVLLCAGLGRRFDPSGQQLKLEQPLGSAYAGRMLAEQSALNLIQAGLVPLAVVRTGRELLAARLQALGCRICWAEANNQGLGDSLASAVQASPQAAGWLVALGDMPRLQPSTLQMLRQQIAQHPSRVIAPCYQGQRGHPVYLPPQHFTLLSQLTGDQGPRQLFANPSAPPLLFDVADAGVCYDVDTPSDLAL